MKGALSSRKLKINTATIPNMPQIIRGLLIFLDVKVFGTFPLFNLKAKKFYLMAGKTRNIGAILLFLLNHDKINILINILIGKAL